MKRHHVLAACLCLALIACESGGTSTTDVERAAEKRVRDKFGLDQDAPLKTDVFVGRPRDGETILCGRVDATASTGTALPTQFFISSTDPSRFLMFGRNDTPGRISQPDMFPDWTKLCAGAGGGTP